ncbi:MAG: ATP-binding protein [Muribaculaceae bacterium]|nr:ATP-binding protein [Muribaculaceae bacterium]
MEETRIIDRPLYTARLLKQMNNNLIKVLTGQRRVGKSYILRYIAQTIQKANPEANIVSINLEDFAFSHIQDAQALNDEIVARLLPGKKNYIFIDEVQEVRDFEKVLRSLLLDADCDIYVTGSNSSMLSSEVATRLAGRCVETRVRPLSYNEFLHFHTLEASYDTLMWYLQHGGLPYLRNIPERYSWNEYVEGIVNSIVFRDIVARHSIRNTDFLQRLLLFLADNIGQIFSAKRISDYLKSQKLQMSVSGVQNYLLYIAEAFIINRCRRWDVEGKRYFEIGEKCYFEDLGIRNALVGFKPDDLSGLLENVVFNHLSIHGYKIKTGQLAKGAEIDFIAEKDSELKYIQVATTVVEDRTREREFGNLEKIRDNYEKIVVTLNDSFPNTHNGIKVYPLLTFLTTFK